MVEVEPALDTEGFFETLYGLARAGKVGPNGQPHPLVPGSLSRVQLAALVVGPAPPTRRHGRHPRRLSQSRLQPASDSRPPLE